VKKEWNEESIKNTLDETKDKLDPIEGIYSVSSDNTISQSWAIVTDKKSMILPG